MSPRRTRRGTIRESIIESSTLSASKILRKTRSRVNKSRAKGSEEESDVPIDTNNVINDSTATTSFLNETSTTARKRRRNQESENQNDTLSATVNEPQSSKKQNSRSKKAKKSTKSNKSQEVDASSLISEDESFSKNQFEDKSKVEDLISEDEEVERKDLRKKIRFDNPNVSSAGKAYKTPEKIPPKTSNQNKASNADITPKSSPLNVSFTPNRSVKTPRKSPENLGSPKTHSHDSIKFLNVPRKLSVVDSPASSENSLQQSNVSIKTVSNKSKTLKSSKSTNQKKIISPTLTAKPRFSKSPKIVFKTPKSKSSNKSPKKTPTSLTAQQSPNISKSLSPTKSKKVSSSPAKSASPTKSEKVSSSPAKSPSPTKSKKVSSPAKSPKSQKSISPLKLIEKRLEVSLVNSSELSDHDIIKQPQKFSKLDSSIESKKSLNSSLNSSKSKKTPSQSKGISKVLSSLKTKKSPKFISPLSSNKTPKIVLMLKSKKSPSKSNKTPSKTKTSPLKLSKSISPSKAKKSPVKGNKNTSLSKAKSSPVKVRKSTSPSKSKKSSEVMNSSKSEKILIKSPRKSAGNNSLKNADLSPMVIVNKLSSSQLDNSSLNSKTKQPTINLIPVDHTPNKVSVRKSKSPKSPKQERIKPITPASKSKTQLNKSMNRVRANLKNSSLVDVLDKRLVNLIPSNTSTPRDLKKRVTDKVLSSNLSNNSITFNGSPQQKSKAIKRLNDKSKDASNFQLLDDESEPSMNESSLIHMSDVFDDYDEPSKRNRTFENDKSVVNSPKKSERNSNISQTSDKNDTFEVEKDNSKNSNSGGNNTYELEHPKTPALKNKVAKKASDHIEQTSKEEVQENKKSVKVTFASPDRRNQARPSTLNRIGTPAHAMQQKRSSTSVRTPTNKALVSKIERKRISSVMTPQSRTSAGSAIKRRSTSVQDSISQSRKSNRETQIASINRLSRPKAFVTSEKKTVVKTPVAKKIPNFSEIHKKNFAKMESIVDLKKRVETRHVTLNTASSAKKVPGSGTKPTPVDSTNGSYNRFGFKLRKNEAINMISKKQINAADTREKKREDARSALKGVRMNRRFELQMKSRTVKS